MEERYKNYIDQIKAPKDLIEDTIKKVNEAAAINNLNKESKAISLKKSKRNRIFYSYLASGTVAAILAIGVGFNLFSDSVKYTSMSETRIRINSNTDKYKNMSIEEYEKYTNVNLKDLFNEEDVKESRINVVMDEQGVNPVYDEAIIDISTEGKLLTVKLSKYDNIIPNELMDSPESKIGDYKAHFGQDNTGKMLYVAGNNYGINYFVIGKEIEKKEFEEKIKKILKNMKPF